MVNMKAKPLFEISEKAKFEREEFFDLLLKNNFVNIEPTLLSDIKTISPYYLNFREFSDNNAVDLTSEHVYRFVQEKFRNEEIDSFVGVPYGMIGVGVNLSMKYGKKVVIAKKNEAKNAESFTKKWFNGLNDGDKVLVLEDIVRTGDDTYYLIERLLKAGAKVVGAVALVDRRERHFENQESSVTQIDPKNLKEKYTHFSDALRLKFGVGFASLSDIHYLLRRYDELKGISVEKKKECAEYYLKNGCDTLVRQWTTGDVEITTKFPFMNEIYSELKEKYSNSTGIRIKII